MSAALTGLKPRTTYHYRVDAVSAGGAVQSGDQTFTTPRANRDRIGPISRFNLKKTVISSTGLHAVGTTTDRGGWTTNIVDKRDRGGVAKVMISFALQTGHANIPLKPGLGWGKPVSVTGAVRPDAAQRHPHPREVTSADKPTFVADGGVTAVRFTSRRCRRSSDYIPRT